MEFPEPYEYPATAGEEFVVLFTTNAPAGPVPVFIDENNAELLVPIRLRGRTSFCDVIEPSSIFVVVTELSASFDVVTDASRSFEVLTDPGAIAGLG